MLVLCAVNLLVFIPVFLGQIVTDEKEDLEEDQVNFYLLMCLALSPYISCIITNFAGLKQLSKLTETKNDNGFVRAYRITMGVRWLFFALVDIYTGILMHQFIQLNQRLVDNIQDEKIKTDGWIITFFLMIYGFVQIGTQLVILLVDVIIFYVLKRDLKIY